MASSSQTDLSDYEKKRLENIKRNAAFLSQLGFDPVAKPENVLSKERKDANTLKKSIQRTKRKIDEVIPTRYSQRLRSMDIEEEQQARAREEVEAKDSVKNQVTSSGGIDYELIPETSEELDDHEFQVYVILRAWRLKTSRELDIEPYKVCQNRTLAELVRRRRNDPNWARRHGHITANLLECWGIGPSRAKLDGFGAQMIELMNANEEVETHLRASREGLTSPSETDQIETKDEEEK